RVEDLSDPGVARSPEVTGDETAAETAPILTAEPDPASTRPARAPNVYQLTSDRLQVSYQTSGLDGQPHFTYQEAERRVEFPGRGIRTAPSDLGTLVTVSTRVTIDTGSTTFTLLVPPISLTASSSASVATQGITATHAFSVLPNIEGQKELYTVT